MMILPEHFFVCHECDKDKEMSTKEFWEHIRIAHHIQKGAAGTREMVLHIAMKPRHQSTYKIQFGDVTFFEYYR